MHESLIPNKFPARQDEKRESNNASRRAAASLLLLAVFPPLSAPPGGEKTIGAIIKLIERNRKTIHTLFMNLGQAVPIAAQPF